MLAYYGSKMDITRMDFSVVVIGLLSFFVLLGAVFAQCSCSDGDDDSNSDTDISFDRNYYVQWGNDHVWPINQGKEIQLSLDLASGYSFFFFQYIIFMLICILACLIFYSLMMSTKVCYFLLLKKKNIMPLLAPNFINRN